MLNDTFGDDPASFIVKRGFMSEKTISRNSKYTDLCEYCLAFSEGMLFQFIRCPQRHGYFS